MKTIEESLCTSSFSHKIHILLQDFQANFIFFWEFLTVPWRSKIGDPLPITIYQKNNISKDKNPHVIWYRRFLAISDLVTLQYDKIHCLPTISLINHQLVMYNLFRVPWFISYHRLINKERDLLSLVMVCPNCGLASVDCSSSFLCCRTSSSVCCWFISFYGFFNNQLFFRILFCIGSREAQHSTAGCWRMSNSLRMLITIKFKLPNLSLRIFQWVSNIESRLISLLIIKTGLIERLGSDAKAVICWEIPSMSCHICHYLSDMGFWNCSDLYKERTSHKQA